MERIRHALEQAEQDRSKLQKESPAPAAPVSTDQVKSDPVETAVPPASATKIGVSRTRVVDVDPAILEQNRIVSALPQHELTDAYRVLRTRVLQVMNANHWNSLAVTSPATGSGKTLTSINLAINLAREVNRTVLLADFDLRRPSIHEYFGYEPEYGLNDYLYNDIPLDKILFSPSIDRLVILPGRESIRNSSETLRSPKMEQLVAELKGRYTDRLVLFDLPPMLALDDALAFKPYTDAMLLVAEDGATKKDDLQKSIEMLKGTPLLGTVLNKSHSPAIRGSYKTQ
jgi:protein-tyrosine kinase